MRILLRKFCFKVTEKPYVDINRSISSMEKFSNTLKFAILEINRNFLEKLKHFPYILTIYISIVASFQN